MGDSTWTRGTPSTPTEVCTPWSHVATLSDEAGKFGVWSLFNRLTPVPVVEQPGAAVPALQVGSIVTVPSVSGELKQVVHFVVRPNGQANGVLKFRRYHFCMVFEQSQNLNKYDSAIVARNVGALPRLSSAASTVVVAAVPSRAQGSLIECLGRSDTRRRLWLRRLSSDPADVQVGLRGLSRQRCITHAVVDLHVRACAPIAK